jgi:BolA protein
MERIDRIRSLLEQRFDPVQLDLEDQSHLHAGHAGARDGRGHFKVVIKAEAFRDKTKLQQHRLVYETLNEMLQTDIHALIIEAHSPE